MKLQKTQTTSDVHPLIGNENYLDVLYDEWIIKLKDSGVSEIKL